MSTYNTTDFLNLRSQPVVAKGNILAVMPPDTVVEKIDGEEVPGWFRIRTVLGKAVADGYASQKYLQPTTEELPPLVKTVAGNIPAVHYPAGNRKVDRNSINLWVYPLNEPGLLKLDLKQIRDAADRAAGIHNVVEYINVEQSRRYTPNAHSTYCNIYAYDLAYCVGAFLPRVWWTPDAIALMQRGQVLTPRYDQNVTEYTANYICNWFEQYGPSFGWLRVFDLTTLQTEVNKGTLGIIVGQRINMNNPGHIVGIIPEDDKHKAEEHNGKITSPLQSQAGAKNKKYYSGYNWWEDSSRFKKFGFWVWKDPLSA
jgi:hypothetical protein